MILITAYTLYNIKFSLWMMVQGMLGIFVFMTVFYLLIYLLERIFPNREQQ